MGNESDDNTSPVSSPTPANTTTKVSTFITAGEGESSPAPPKPKKSSTVPTATRSSQYRASRSPSVAAGPAGGSGGSALYRLRSLPGRKNQGPPPLPGHVSPPKRPDYSVHDTGITSRVSQASRYERTVQDEAAQLENRLSRLRILESRGQYKMALEQRHAALVQKKRRMNAELQRDVEEAKQYREAERVAQHNVRQREKEARVQFHHRMEGLFMQKHKEVAHTKHQLSVLKSTARKSDTNFADWVRAEAQEARRVHKERAEQAKTEAEQRAATLAQQRAEERRENERLINEEKSMLEQHRKAVWDTIHGTRYVSKEVREAKRAQNKERVVEQSTQDLEKKKDSVRRLQDYMERMRREESTLLAKMRSMGM